MAPVAQKTWRVLVRPVLLVVLSLGAVLACSGPASVEGEPAETSTRAAEEHVSRRLGYALRLPPGWLAGRQAFVDWEMQVPPTAGMPPFDTFVEGDRLDPWLLVGRMTVPRGMRLGGWIDQLRATQTITYPGRCESPELDDPTTLGGEAAHLVGLRCPGDQPEAVGVQILAVHRDAGYVALCYSEEVYGGQLAELRRDCENWVLGFRYLD